MRVDVKNSALPGCLEKPENLEKNQVLRYCLTFLHEGVSHRTVERTVEPPKRKPP